MKQSSLVKYATRTWTLVKGINVKPKSGREESRGEIRLEDDKKDVTP